MPSSATAMVGPVTAVTPQEHQARTEREYVTRATLTHLSAITSRRVTVNRPSSADEAHSERRKQIRTLHVAPTVAASDGTSVAVLAMLKALGDETNIAAQLLAGEYAAMPLHPGLPRDSSVHILPVRQLLGGRFGYGAAYPPGFRDVLSTLAAAADVVHLHGLWLYPTLVGGPILRDLGKPYVLSLHGALMTDALARSRLKKILALTLFERRNIESASVVIATSRPELDQLRSLGLSSKATVLPLAIDPAAMAFFAASRKPETADTRDAKRERTVLCVSRFHSRKRLVEVVQAFASVAEELGDWRLRMLGPDYEQGYRNKVLAAAQESGLAGRISVEPALEGEQLWRAYTDADLFVLASTFENFGLVIAEALAAGVPVIATRGTPWPQLAAERCGWWIDPSLEALPATLKGAMSQPSVILREMGQRGSRLVERDFSLPALGTALSSLYDSVLDRRTG
jgi:glycosyltransferase involved in cell wall biosynthesis